MEERRAALGTSLLLLLLFLLLHPPTHPPTIRSTYLRFAHSFSFSSSYTHPPTHPPLTETYLQTLLLIDALRRSPAFRDFIGLGLGGGWVERGGGGGGGGGGSVVDMHGVDVVFGRGLMEQFVGERAAVPSLVSFPYASSAGGGWVGRGRALGGGGGGGGGGGERKSVVVEEGKEEGVGKRSSCVVS